MRIAQNPLLRTAWQEISYNTPHYDLIGGILENDPDLEAWADNEHLSDPEGFVRMLSGKKVGVIDIMFASPRGEGWGNKTLERFTRQARRMGCDAVVLLVGIYEKNVRALKGMNLAKWYERHGFEHVGMAGGEWAEEGEKPTLPLMVKWLVPQEPARPKKATGTPAFTCQLEIVDAHRDELFGRVTAWAGEDAGAWKSVPDGKGGHTETRRGVKVGYLHFSEYRDEVWVQYVFVDPAWRRKGVATAMYEKVGQEFPGEKITSSGTTGEGGKLRKSLNQKGIVAKAMDYGQVRNVLASLMPDVRGDLPVPELKVVNNIKSRWLGDCRWTIGKPNTVITLQKSICGDDETLRRILAHELAHHEEMLVYWQGKLNEGMTPQTVKMLSGVMGGHGRSWKEVADRWNAKYGKDFVTEKSDQAMVVEYDEKPFYVLLHRYPYGNNNRLWQYSAHLSQKQKELLATPKLQDPGQYKLVETTDRRFLCKAGISPYGGYAIARGPELEAKFDEMWGQPDVREGWLTSVTASSSGGGAMDALLRRINSKDWWHVPPEDPKAYSKRGQFLASTFREAEFWGRPLDAPLHVHVANPLVGDEESILRDLGLGGIPDDAGVAARFFLDARMKQEAEKRGFDSIVLFSPSNYKRFVGQGTVPISIELNVFKPVFAPENKQAAGRAGNVGTAWHGTSEDAAYSIKEKGLVPGKFWGTAYATPDKGLAIYYALGDALGKGLKEGIDPEKEPGRMPDVFLVRIDDPRGAGMDLQPRVGLGDDEIDVYLKRGPVGPQHISAVERYRYKDLLPYLKKRISPTARWQGVKKGISRVPPYRTEGIKKAAARPIRTPALDAWFGNSRVVDAAGRPLVVYHGSKSPWVSSFDLGMAGTSWAGAAGVEKGIWFTSSKDNARFFSDSGPKKKADEASIQGYGKDGEFYAAVFTLREEPIFSVGPYPTIEKAEEEAKSQARMYNRKLRTDTHVMAVYLKIENPLVLDGIVPRKAEFDWAKKNGRDGIIARDVYDGATQSDVYVIFSPSQVKSADRNTGTFDPDDLSITASGKETMPTPEVLDALRRIRGSIRMDESASAAASEGQCGFVSEAASKKFGWGIEGGFYLPDGIPAPHGRRPNFGHLDHVWNVLKDGTVIDGTHDQFGKPDVNVVRPGQPGHEKYHAFCGDPKCPCCACPQCNPDGAKVGSLKKAFVRQDLAWLKGYLTMTDAEKGEELARQFPHRFFDWLSGQELPEGWKAPKDLEDLIDNDMFSGLPPAMCEQFLRSDEGMRAVDDDPMDAPSFMHMEYEGIVRNQWLVHKTDEPGEISLHGFTRGMWDLARLGLITYFTDKAKTGGYNFAVPADEAGRIEGKYGKHAVLFRASGIRIHHYGDEEDQVIFWGRDARDIVSICEIYGKWCLPEGGNGRPVFEAERLQDAVDWAVANFQQYRRWLVLAPTAGKEPKPGSPLLAPKAPVTASAKRRIEMPRSPRKYLEGLGLSAGADLKIREWALPDQVEYLNSIKFPLTVYRQLEVPAGKKVNLENVGIYWSDNVDSAQSYWGPSSIWTPSVGGEEGGIVTLRAEVLSEDDVDWEGTLHANAKDPDEDEIRLVPGARIRLTGIEEPKDNDFRTMNKMVTASHKQTPHRENEFPDLGEGEAIGGYGTQPECIDGNRTGLSLEELEEQAKTAATGDWLYHVTYFNRLEDIIWLGLETGHPASIGGLYGWHTKGRSFLTEWRGVGFWYQRAVDWAYHNSDSPVEEGLVPVVLRTKEAKRLKVQPDEVGTGDAVADAFFTERSIPAARLQVWDGRQWTRLTEDAMQAMTPEGYVREADRPLTDPEEGEEGSGDDEEYYIDEGVLYPKTAGAMEGMPSWEEWKRQHGGIEGMVRDVDSWDQWEPYEEDEVRKFDALPEEEQAKWVYGNAEEHLRGRYDELLRQHGRWTFPLTVYRMLSLVGGRKAVNPKKIGIFWSWDENSAEAHWGSFGPGTEEILLQARVGKDDIDWEGTFEANMDPATGEEEREIRLKEGVHPVIVAWKKGGYGWRAAPKAWRTMTAFKYDKGQFHTGVPAVFRGYHVTGADGRIKWGEGGAFFSEDPAPEYGTHYVVATLRMANPLVAEDQWDATRRLTDLPGMEDLDKALSDDTGPPQTQEEWARVDRSVARLAQRAGHDGLVYTDIAALTDMEFVVFDPSQVTNVSKPVDTQVYVDKLLREMKKDKYAKPSATSTTGPDHAEGEAKAASVSAEAKARRGFRNEPPEFDPNTDNAKFVYRDGFVQQSHQPHYVIAQESLPEEQLAPWATSEDCRQAEMEDTATFMRATGAVRVAGNNEDDMILHLEVPPSPAQVRRMAEMARRKTVYWLLWTGAEGEGSFADFQRAMEGRQYKVAAGDRYMGQPAGKIPSSGVVTIYRGTPGPEDRPRPRDFAAVFFSTSRESARQYGEHVTKYELPVDWLHILDIDGPEAVPLAREYMRIEGWEEAMFADDADVDDYMANYFMFPERGWVDFLGKKGYAGTSIGGDLALFRPALRMVRKAASLSILAFDYGAMFKALFADISRVGGSGSVTRCKDDFDFYLEWAKKALKRRDRIMWFMRLVRIHCAQEFLENESKLDKRYPADLTPQKSGQAEDSAIFSKWGKFLIQERARYGFVPNVSAVRNLKAFQRILEHYMSLPVPAIQNTVFQWQHPTVLLDEFGWAEKEWQESRSHLLKPHPRDEGNDRDSGDEIVIDFKNGWAWWKLGRSYCPEEAKAMGHCGNEAAGPDRPDDRILSLRRKVVIKGDTWWEPHLTFIWDDEGVLGEMKGRNNDKPAAKYHPYIVALLERKDLIWGIKGGGYMPSHNFSMNDLPKEQRDRLGKLNRGLLSTWDIYNEVGREMTPEVLDRIGERTSLDLDHYDPLVGGFVVEEFANPGEFVHYHGSERMRNEYKMITGGFLSGYDKGKEEGMLDLLTVMTPEERRAALAFANPRASNLFGMNLNALSDDSPDGILRTIKAGMQAPGLEDGFSELWGMLGKAWEAGITPEMVEDARLNLKEKLTGSSISTNDVSRVVFPYKLDSDFWKLPVKVVIDDEDAIRMADGTSVNEDWNDYDPETLQIYPNDWDGQAAVYDASKPYREILDRMGTSSSAKRKLEERIAEVSFKGGSPPTVVEHLYHEFLKGRPYRFLEWARKEMPDLFGGARVEGAWDAEVALAALEQMLSKGKAKA